MIRLETTDGKALLIKIADINSVEEYGNNNSFISTKIVEEKIFDKKVYTVNITHEVKQSVEEIQELISQQDPVLNVFNMLFPTLEMILKKANSDKEDKPPKSNKV